MSQPFIAPRDMTVQLPWLAPLDEIFRRVGLDDTFSFIDVPQGTDVYILEPSQRARLILPDGRIRSWERFSELDIRPADPSWDVTWRSPMSDKHPSFGFVGDGEGYSISLEGFEGREAHLFPDFVRLITDPELNPHGFPITDGRYESNMNVDFEVYFGRNGQKQEIKAAEEMIGTQPNIPYETLIIVREDADIYDARHEREVRVSAGAYVGKITAWYPKSGEVLKIRYKGDKGSFTIDGKTFMALMHGKKIELAKVLQDRMPNY